jgi:hypothetical protein
MELNVFVEDYIKENHSQYSDKAQEEMRKVIRIDINQLDKD